MISSVNVTKSAVSWGFGHIYWRNPKCKTSFFVQYLYHKVVLIRIIQPLNYGSSHRMCSVKKGVLRNFVKFSGKHLCQRLFFNKVEGLRPATLLKKSLWHRYFPVNFAKFLKIPFVQNTSGRLLLEL